MGVNGLWTVVQPCARPTNLATLNRKRLAVDASIWIYQFLKAVRDKEGNALRNSHVVGFFRRICKLLWFGIQPVFVFDGGAPTLKRATLQGRRRRREGRRDDAVRTAGKLLAVQMQRAAEVEGEERRRRRRDEEEGRGAVQQQEEEEVVPDLENIVYAEEVGMSNQERKKNRGFRKTDAYHLPELETSIDNMGKPEDPRIMSIEELEEYARQFHAGEDVNLYDFSKIDFDGEFFKSLPPADRYNILNAARLRSRLRMGLSKEQLDDMFPDRMAFSRFQIERVKERNHLTQRLMKELGMIDTDVTGGRIAGEKNREYILVRNEGAEGGWALGVVNKESKDVGQVHKPIDVDAYTFQYQGKDTVDEEWEDEDEDFEDVPIEGLNRLPKVGSAAQPADGEIDGLEESLFVNDDDAADLFGDDDAIAVDEDEDLAKTVAMSLENQHETPSMEQGPDGEKAEDLNRAVAVSLKNQHKKSPSVEDDSAEDEEFEDVEAPAPQWKQKAAEVPSRPIAATTRATGRMVAHIVNNRANAAVRRRESTDSSDSDMDLQAALRKAAKKKAVVRKKPVEKAPIKLNVKNPFSGPLPFEKLDWKGSIFASALKTAPAGSPKKPSASRATGEHEAEDDDMAGGFEREPAKKDDEMAGGFERGPEQKDLSAPLPLPPWMADNTDIRETYKKQTEADAKVAAEDEALAREEMLQTRRKREKERIEILSSDEDDSDVEIVDAPPPKATQASKETSDSRLGPSNRDASKTISATIVEKSPENGDDVVNLVEEDTSVAPAEPETGRDAAPVTDTRRSPSPDVDFEDVEMSPRPGTAQLEKEKTDKERADDIDKEFEEMMRADSPPARPEHDGAHKLTYEDIMQEDVQPGRINGLATADPIQRDIDPNAPGEEEFDDFSDPEEEELLAQMAEEAEEHARFASELNHKSQAENQADYERELKQLRAQQKKDRRDADEVTQIMVTECQALLRLFGIPYITAPMEAEAQCAELVSLGLVDGIVTDDSDTFLFGGTRVYKNMFNGNKLVECYLAVDIEKELSLSRHELISLALLLGSDYTEGLPGVGPVTAVEILSEFPGPDGLKEFKDWWQDVQLNNRPKAADADSAFRRKFRKSQGTKLFLPPGFPNPAVAEAYLKPEVDRSAEPFQWGVPNLEGLRQFLMATIGWSQERTDEVLVPVIRDMNKRGVEGTQSNITRYFEGSVGVGAKEAFAPRQRAKGSKRMAEAVTKLKAKNAGFSMSNPVVAPPEPKAGKKRKGRQAVTVVDDDDSDGADVNEVDEEDNHDQPATGKQSSTASRRALGKGKRVKA